MQLSPILVYRALISKTDRTWHRIPRRWTGCVAAVCILATVGCENPIKKAFRETEYSAYELVGIQKRDLLKKRINETQKEEKETGENFSDALEKLRSLYGMSGGDLEKNYKDLKASYETCAGQAKQIRSSIDKMEAVAHDLFREWESEMAQIQTPELKVKSREKLTLTKKRFETLDRDLRAAEKKMEPVLTKLNDQMLYLKHNLNAESIQSLSKEKNRIEDEIGQLISDMNKAITKSDEFIKTIE